MNLARSWHFDRYQCAYYRKCEMWKRGFNWKCPRDDHPKHRENFRDMPAELQRKCVYHTTVVTCDSNGQADSTKNFECRPLPVFDRDGWSTRYYITEVDIAKGHLTPCNWLPTCPTYPSKATGGCPDSVLGDCLDLKTGKQMRCGMANTWEVIADCDSGWWWPEGFRDDTQSSQDGPLE